MFGFFGFIEEKQETVRKEKILPGGESNPGLPRDRRGYSPLYYRGFGGKTEIF